MKQKQIAVFGGSFCPITAGHIDIITRASKLVDKLYVVIGVNFNKQYAISLADRLALVKKATKHLDNVTVDSTDGLMTDYCKKVNATIMFKAVRNACDMQEFIDITEINKRMWQGETVCLVCDKQYQHISSTVVRELVKYNQPIEDIVPCGLQEEITALLKGGADK